jgi:uncharacterized phage-like protein YoqJ
MRQSILQIAVTYLLFKGQLGFEQNLLEIAGMDAVRASLSILGAAKL